MGLRWHYEPIIQLIVICQMKANEQNEYEYHMKNESEWNEKQTIEYVKNQFGKVI